MVLRCNSCRLPSQSDQAKAGDKCNRIINGARDAPFARYCDCEGVLTDKPFELQFPKSNSKSQYFDTFAEAFNEFKEEVALGESAMFIYDHNKNVVVLGFDMSACISLHRIPW